MKYPAYPAYKPSGVEWLDDVPKHWAVKRLKYVASANDDVLTEDTPGDWELIYVDIGSVEAAGGITTKEPMVFEKAPSRARRRVKDGDTIVATVRTYLKAIAPVQKPEPNLIVSTGFAVLRPRAVDPDFMSFYLRSSLFVETVVSRSVGVSYPATNASDVVAISIPLPKPEEQYAIAAFLDVQTTKIDTLVEKKRALIEKLKEKRVALISRMVTHGLPPEAARAAGLTPHPKLRPSGIDWLGEVPEHWEIRPLFRIASTIQTGPFGSQLHHADYFYFVRFKKHNNLLK